MTGRPSKSYFTLAADFVRGNFTATQNDGSDKIRPRGKS
jgi:hypothetical protein